MTSTYQGPDALPAVSIGLPVFNGARYLRQSIESLLSQSFTNLELIISDNASTDDTEALCREYANSDARVRYSRLPQNIGGVANHMRVAQLARGRYFMFASSDDAWMPTYVERCAAVLDADPSVVVAYTINAVITGPGMPERIVPIKLSLDIDDAVERFRRLTDIHGGIEVFYGLIRLDALRRLAPMKRHPGFDRIFFAELGLLGKMRQIPERLYLRRIHSGQSVGTHPSLRSRYRWISPNRQQRFVWPHFEYVWHFATVALRSAPSASARVGCLVHLLKWSSWQRRLLWQDIIGAE